MSQHDFNIANGPGATFRGDLNNALAALASMSSGATAPSPTFACQMWADTGTGRIRRRDSGNTFWIDLGPINQNATGQLIAVRVFAAAGSSTYTPTAGTNSVIAEVQGAGGAGAGAPATGAGNGSLGSSGGAGAYAISFFSTGFSGVTITVGAGGTGVSGAAGNVGGTSSFGGLISCPGGKGGNTAGPSSGAFFAFTGNSNAATGGNLSSNVGAGGAFSICLNSGSLIAGPGGASMFGPGAVPSGIGGTGIASGSYGSGGAGTIQVASGSAATGGAGANGIVRVWEYS
jgi:hypothetical protein